MSSYWIWCFSLWFLSCPLSYLSQLTLKNLKFRKKQLWPEVITGTVLWTKDVKNSRNSHANTCVRVSYLLKLQARPATLLKKETPTQVFSCELIENFKNTFFTEHPGRQASVWWILFPLRFQAYNLQLH